MCQRMRSWCEGFVLELTRCVSVLSVLELDEEKDTAGERKRNGDVNREDQTQMTPFEIDMKDKRFVAASAAPQRLL